MKTEVIKKNNIKVAVVSSDELLITDVQSALDLIMTVKYETDCTNIAINKEAVVKDFFVLSTCLAGEIMQKFKGKDMYFQPTASLAVDKLSGCAQRKLYPPEFLQGST